MDIYTLHNISSCHVFQSSWPFTNNIQTLTLPNIAKQRSS
jgi:hypothetical protein